MILDVFRLPSRRKKQKKSFHRYGISLRRFPCLRLRLQQFHRLVSVDAVTSSLPLQVAVSAGLYHRREESLDVSNLRSVHTTINRCIIVRLLGHSPPL